MAVTAQPRRTQAERSTRTRDVLLRAAVDVIARRGYVEATLQEIGDTAGVSKSAVTYHFRAKHELVPRVLEHCVALLRASTARAWRGGATPADRMRAALRAMWEVRRDRAPEVSALLELLALGRRDEPARAALTAVIRDTERELGVEIAEALAALGLRPRVPPAVIPRLLLGLLDGLALYAPYGGEDIAPAVEALAFAMLTV